MSQTQQTPAETVVPANTLKTAPGMVRIYANSVTGDLVTPTKKDGFSSIGVESIGFRFNNGIGRKVRTTALLTMPNDDLNDFLQSYKLGVGSQFTGKINVQESTTPFWAGQTPKINPTTGAIMTSGGMPIYRNTNFTEDINAVDTILKQDTVAVVVEDKQLA